MENNETSRRIRNLIISLATFAALILYASTYSEPVLRVSVMPEESPLVLRHKNKPLIDYLEKKVGMKIEYRPTHDGDTLVDSLLGNKIDMAWLDGFYFVRARMRSNNQVVPLVQRAEDEKIQNAYTWTVRADMDSELRQKLTDAFLALDKNVGADKEILDLQRASRFIPAHAENHVDIEAAASRRGRLP
jgi:ABC-type phosphate/phosphonate transport system substrate-binding protein